MQVYRGEHVPGISQLLGEDVCTFSMLSRILGGACTKIVTDHARVIMCLSVRPFPVWVWVAPDAGREELERVCDVLLAEFPPQEHSYNVGLPLSRALLETDETLRVSVGLMAYHCKAAIAPRKTPGGCLSLVREEEVDLAARWYQRMHKECALNEDVPYDAARGEVMDYVGRRAMFFWRDEAGVPRAMCGVDTDEHNAYVTHVYTPPESRRKGYAGNLVYAVTRTQLKAGKTPMLYTDADYPASNACYTQIGYRLQGELRTVGR